MTGLFHPADSLRRRKSAQVRSGVSIMYLENLKRST
jgi:hypothetical protein